MGQVKDFLYFLFPPKSIQWGERTGQEQNKIVASPGVAETLKTTGGVLLRINPPQSLSLSLSHRHTHKQWVQKDNTTGRRDRQAGQGENHGTAFPHTTCTQK